MIWYRKIPSRFTPDYLIFNIWLEIGVYSPCRDQIHLTVEKVFEVLDETHEIPEGSLSSCKFDKNAGVTDWGHLSPGNRAEDANSLYTKEVFD